MKIFVHLLSRITNRLISHFTFSYSFIVPGRQLHQPLSPGASRRLPDAQIVNLRLRDHRLQGGEC